MNRSIIPTLCAILLARTGHTYAQTSIWDGGSASTANWTDNANWVGDVAPSAGHDLLFPAGAARKINTNNFAAFTSFKRIIFDGGGYQLRGNNIRLSGVIPDVIPIDPPNIIEYTAPATNEIYFNILVAETNKTAAIEAGNKVSSILTLYGDINLIFNPTLIFESGQIDHRGAITGIGSVQVYPNARAIFNNTVTNNTYDGYTAVSGELELFKDTAIPGDVQLSAPSFFPAPGTITWLADDQVYDFGEFDFYGTLNFPGTADTIGNFNPLISVEILGNPGLSLNGDLRPVGNPFAPGEPCKLFGSGAWLTFPAGDHTINQTNLISGLWLDARVRGPGNITKIGTNDLYLARSNDFNGVLTILDGPVIASNNWSLGSTAGHTVVGSNGLLRFAGPATSIYESITLQPGSTLRADNVANYVYLRSPVNVTGAGPANIHTAGLGIFITNALSGSGSLVLTGGSSVVFAGSANNTHLGSVTLVDGGDLFLQKTNGAKAISGPLILGDDNPGNGLEICFIYEPEQVGDHVTVNTRSDSTLAVFANETIASLTGNGRATIEGSSTLTVGFGDASFEFSGYFYAAGFLEKIGAGTAVLSGNSPDFDGEITVNAGVMDIRGLYAGATTAVIPGARLTGNGSVANLLVQNNGIYQPGRAKKDGLNVMTSSNLHLAVGSIFRVAIWGGNADEHGRAAVKGVAVISNAVLDVQLLAPPPVGAEYVLIDNDGAEPVQGIFAGLPGGTFTGPGGLEWEIEYGNDVTLRLLSQGLSDMPPPSEGHLFKDIIVQGGNGDAYVQPNECVQLYIPIFNETMQTTDVGQVTLISYFEDLVVNQPYSLYPDLLPEDSAYNITPFQVSVPKGFQCGTNLPMALVIKQGTNAPYALPIGLPTGKPAAVPIRYDSAGPQEIPDEGLQIDFVFVTGFTGHLAKAEISVHVAHEQLQHVSLALVAPGGSYIPLTGGRPGTEYGTGCTDANRTMFALDAATNIIDATAPYVGTYRPTGILPLVRGMPSSLVTNRWYLYVEDSSAGVIGTNVCWSLFLYPAECEEGEGGCETCPAPITDSVDLIELPGAARLARFDPEAEPTACGDEPAPDYYAAPGNFYYKTYTFYNLSEAETCASVTLNTACTGVNAIISSAHLGAYNPALPWLNALGYIGETPGYNSSPRAYSFVVPGLEEITVVVSATESFTTCGGFTLQVNSPDLCPAELAIRPSGSDKVQLDWSTGAAGYLLQSNGGMMTTNWAFIPDTPVVSDGRFVITNTPIDPDAYFRLLKP